MFYGFWLEININFDTPAALIPFAQAKMLNWKYILLSFYVKVLFWGFKQMYAQLFQVMRIILCCENSV